MRRRLAVLPLVLMAGSLATAACLTTKNFKDPAGPLYEGRYAPTAAGDASISLSFAVPSSDGGAAITVPPGAKGDVTMGDGRRLGLADLLHLGYGVYLHFTEKRKNGA